MNLGKIQNWEKLQWVGIVEGFMKEVDLELGLDRFGSMRKGRDTDWTCSMNKGKVVWGEKAF